MQPRPMKRQVRTAQRLRWHKAVSFAFFQSSEGEIFLVFSFFFLLRFGFCFLRGGKTEGIN